MSVSIFGKSPYGLRIFGVQSLKMTSLRVVQGCLQYGTVSPQLTHEIHLNEGHSAVISDLTELKIYKIKRQMGNNCTRYVLHSSEFRGSNGGNGAVLEPTLAL